MNPFLLTDVYKMGHMEQFPEGITKIYSYLTTRSDQKYDHLVWYGLQSLLKKYLSGRPTVPDVKEFLKIREEVLGTNTPQDIIDKLLGLVLLGHWPLKIKALPEGIVIPNHNVLMTMTNTHPDHAWLVGFFESMLLKVWSTCSVATLSRKYRLLAERFADMTCDDRSHIPYAVHDFGYRGCSSEETAAAAGSAHLINFKGSDTVSAVKFIKDYYGGLARPIASSVPATEHSVMCAYGKEGEFEAIERMLDLYPSGTVSIVSDSYDFWRVLTEYVPRLRSRILEREGKVVFRPDSGAPINIICGDIQAPSGPSGRGALRILADIFGYTVNKKGYKVLNPKVGLIYGDAMYYERYKRMLKRMMQLGYASSNLVIGVGGLLLQQHNRDDLGFAIKATYCEINGKSREIMKDPITDSKKKSLKGRVRLDYVDGKFKTTDQVSPHDESTGMLREVFFNRILRNQPFSNVICKSWLRC